MEVVHSKRKNKFCFDNYKSRFGPDGLHLFNRETGTNILIDEVEIPVDRWSMAPRQVSIALTNTCDLSCSHCYAPKNKAKLEFGLLTSLLRTLDLNGCMGVGFGGGEPTLYPKFAELCEFAAIETGLAVTMTTHGHRLDEILLKKISGRIHFVRVSMDGVGATYENIRNRSFDSLVNKVKLLKDVSPFGINFVVNSTTIKELDEAARIADDLGAAELLLLPEVTVGRGVGIDNDTAADMQNWIQAYQGNARLAISETHVTGIPVCEPFEKETGVSAYAHIDASGILRRNSFAQDGVLIEGEDIMDALQVLREKNK
ncbi:radical SAM protein [Microbulbifer elongatus]|uniref:radical SAM protein n=1 Tax=Microbulbifer elongatus TaxID=86173 RepID=UPI001E4801EB|nr:radical SAM protein [Microbulbifer elongatus]